MKALHNSRLAGHPAATTRLCIVVLLLLATVPAASRADEGRVLGGYCFVPSSVAADPFITTHFRSATGLAWASNVDIPVIVLEGPPPDTLLSFEGNFLFITADVEYQHAVNEKVAVRVFGGGASRVGTSGEALISQGVTAAFGGGVGVTAEMWRTDAMLLSGVADLYIGENLVVNILNFAEDVINEGISKASILDKETGTVLSGGLRYAWAINQWSGVTALGYAGVTNLEGRKNYLLWRLTGAYSIDFGQRGGKPIGVQFHINGDRLNEKVLQAGTIIGAGLGVYYTGQEDFNIGLEYNWSRMPLKDWDVVVHPSTFGLAVRYYF